MSKVLLVAALVLSAAPAGWAETCQVGSIAAYTPEASSCIRQRASFRDFSYSQTSSAPEDSTQAVGWSAEIGARGLASGGAELSPVDAPEPTSMLLLGSGLLGLAGFIRLRHRTKR